MYYINIYYIDFLSDRFLLCYHRGAGRDKKSCQIYIVFLYDESLCQIQASTLMDIGSGANMTCLPEDEPSRIVSYLFTTTKLWIFCVHFECMCCMA